MKSGLEGRNKRGGHDPVQVRVPVVSMKSGLEGRNKLEDYFDRYKYLRRGSQ